MKCGTGVVFAVMLLVASAALGQTDPTKEEQDAARKRKCGPMPEVACGELLLATSVWNDRFGDIATIQNVQFTGSVEGNAQKLKEQITSADARLPVVSCDRPIAVIQLKNATVDGADVEAWQKLVDELLKHTEYVANISWATANDKFVTSALLSREGILYDNILTNVRERRTSNSCAHEQMLWIWGGVSGEIKIDLVPIYENGRVTACSGTHYNHMILGRSRSWIGESSIRAGRCYAKYAWAWSTPIASIKFNATKFQFEIKGLGSQASGGGDCWSPRP